MARKRIRHVLALLIAASATSAWSAQDDLEALFGDEPRAQAHDEPASERQAGADAEMETPEVVRLPPDDPPKPAKRPGRRVIEEIVVTAQKTEQSLRDVPMSVSALGGEQLEDAAVTDPTELVQYTPNVKISAGWSAITTVTIRGFGSPPFGRGIEPSVGIVIDDVFYGRSSFIGDGIFDLERVEVLRGPQGTLFGKNTAAGLMNFTTREPSLDGMEQALTAGLSSHDGQRLNGALSLPIKAGAMAARVAFRAQRLNSGIHNTTRDAKEGVRELAARLKFRWLPSDTLSIDFSALRSHSEAVGIGLQLTEATERALAVAREFDPQAEDDPFDLKLSTDSETFIERTTESLSLKLSQDLPDLLGIEAPTLTLVASRATIENPFAVDTDGLPFNFSHFTTDGPERYQQNSLELRLVGRSKGPFGFGQGMEWIGGLFYFGSRFRVTQISELQTNNLATFVRAGGGGLVPTGAPDGVVNQAVSALGIPLSPLLSELAGSVTANGPPQVVEGILHSRSEAYSAFTQGTWQLNDRLSAIIGLRLGQESKSGFQSSSSNSPLGPIFAGQQDFTNEPSLQEREFTPKLALSYDLDDQITLFGNITRGYKSGGFSGPLQAPTNLLFRPESALSSELGVKSRLLGGSLLLNATAFRVNFDDLQLNIFDGVNTSTVNAAAATAYGLEVDFHWRPHLQMLSLAGSLGFPESGYDRFPCGPATVDDDGSDDLPECGGGAGPSFPPDRRTVRPIATQDLTGRPMPYAPRITGSLSPMLRLPLSLKHGIAMMIGLDVLYQGEQFLDADLDPVTYQPATTKLNARIGIVRMDRRWSLILNGKNLTGEKERAFVFDAPSLPNNYMTVPQAVEPQFSLDLSYNFEGG